MKRKQLANAACLFTAAIWGFGFIATARSLDTFSPTVTLALRFSGAALLYWFLFLLKKDKKISISLWKKSFLSGLFLFLAFMAQTFGLAHSDTGTNAFLTSVNVVLVPYLVWFLFKKRPKLNQVIAGFLCLAGILLLSVGSQGLHFREGDWFSLACAFFFALQIIANEQASKVGDAITINSIQMSTAALLSIPCALVWESWPQSISPLAWLSVGYSIFLATGLAYFLQTWAQKYTDAASASILLGTESLFANIFGFLILHEQKSGWMLLGGALIFCSILLVEASGFWLSNKANESKIASEEMG